MCRTNVFPQWQEGRRTWTTETTNESPYGLAGHFSRCYNNQLAGWSMGNGIKHSTTSKWFFFHLILFAHLRVQILSINVVLFSSKKCMQLFCYSLNDLDLEHKNRNFWKRHGNSLSKWIRGILCNLNLKIKKCAFCFFVFITQMGDLSDCSRTLIHGRTLLRRHQSTHGPIQRQNPLQYPM